MNITEPTPDEVAAIVAANSFRFADLNHITVIGDRGAAVRLPFILGNPTGAGGVAAARQTTIWNSFVAAVLQRTPLPEGEDAAAQDVILWPPPATWSQWSERWPALAGQVWQAAKKKCGAQLELQAEPAYDDETLPDAVKAALAASPRAAMRRYRPNKASFLFLLDPPSSAAWRMFQESIRKGTDVAKVTSQMAQACTRFIFDEKSGAEATFDATVAHWPGLAVQACLTVAVLAGAASTVELGE